MNKPLSCGAQDLLEAAIIQKRRLTIHVQDGDGQGLVYEKVLPVDVSTRDGAEWLTILTTDNTGGILKLTLNTAEITGFTAKDFLDPAIRYP
jgi:transcriptional antiterminator Rof (Rho-off)